MYYRRLKYEIPTFKRVILLIDIEVQKGNTAVLTLKWKNDTSVSSIVRYKDIRQNELYVVYGSDDFLQICSHILEATT